VAEDHHQPRIVARGGEFDAADLRGCNDVAGNPNYEQVPQTLIEHNFRRNPRIGAAKDDRERLLPRRQCGTPGVTQESVRLAQVQGESAIALSQPFECFGR
jgi:hypothetical protein